MTTGRRLGIGFAAFAVLFFVAVVAMIRHLEVRAWERISGHWENRVESYRDFYAEQALADGSLWDEAELREWAVLDERNLIEPPRSGPWTERNLWGSRWRRSRVIYLSALPRTWVKDEPPSGGVHALRLAAERHGFGTDVRALVSLWDRDEVNPVLTEKLRDLLREVGIDLEVEWP